MTASEFGRRVGESLPVRCLRRFARIDGRSRSLAIAGQAFITLVPLMIIVGGPLGGRSLGESLVVRFRLSGDSADAVRTLFAQPPRAGGAMSLLGVLVLLISLLSLTRSLQSAYEAAWDMPSTGLRGTMSGLTGMSLLVAELVVLALLTSLIRPLPAGSALSVVLRLALAVPMWLLLQYLLLSRRVPIRRLLPGAAAAAVGQVLLTVYSALWMPHIVGLNAVRYGLIGVTFAIVSWLIVIAIAVVTGAVVSAELADRMPHPRAPRPDPAGPRAPRPDPAGPRAAGPAPGDHEVSGTEPDISPR